MLHNLVRSIVPGDRPLLDLNPPLVLPPLPQPPEPTLSPPPPPSPYHWYGDFSNLCQFAPIPACNLLAIDAPPNCSLVNHPFKDVAAIVVSALGVLIVIRFIWRSHRFFAAVGKYPTLRQEGRCLYVYFNQLCRTEMGMLLFVYCIISLLQVFSIGGLVSRSRIFMMFLLGTCTALITTVLAVSMDMALDPNKQQLGQSPALFFFVVVFPLVTILLYIILIIILVYRSLDERRVLAWIVLALAFFTCSQLVVFSASAKLCAATHGHINGSMFAILFDIAAVSSVYKFWNTVTDDTWGDCVF
ncbi:hypothetical protein DFQ27_001075 [Actinomortierella ambigua]|uniref:Chitin synthase export chaperone n=1 Tax=Actinomortierella ambigua TaxID=1343610 RepID=A0A9P6U836_9FUNG|nr:hypothetical protein DFQ27_001075 [Actinomortierella ambigua]